MFRQFTLNLIILLFHTSYIRLRKKPYRLHLNYEKDKTPFD